VLRPREILVSSRADSQRRCPASPRSTSPSPKWRPGASAWTARVRCSPSSCRRSASKGSGSRDTPPRSRRPGRCCGTCATRRRWTSHIFGASPTRPRRGAAARCHTLAHLEIVEGAGGGREGSLLHHLDRTQTALGARLLRAWVMRPLGRAEPIQDRLDAVEEFAYRTPETRRLRETLRAVHDLERLVSRAALGTAGPRDLVSLRESIAAIPRVRAILGVFEAPLVRSLLGELDDLTDLREDLSHCLVDEPAAPGPRRRRHPPGCGPGARRPARREPARPDADRRDGAGRAGAHGCGLAEDPVQSGVRLLHRVSKANLGAVPDDYHASKRWPARNATRHRH